MAAQVRSHGGRGHWCVLFWRMFLGALILPFCLAVGAITYVLTDGVPDHPYGDGFTVMFIIG